MKKGFLRIWVIGAVLWIAIMTWALWQDAKYSDFEKREIVKEKLIMPDEDFELLIRVSDMLFEDTSKYIGAVADLDFKMFNEVQESSISLKTLDEKEYRFISSTTKEIKFF